MYSPLIHKLSLLIIAKGTDKGKVFFVGKTQKKGLFCVDKVVWDIG